MLDLPSRAQIPWGEEYEHETARTLFGPNLLALTWIKGAPMPSSTVDEILRALGLERKTGTRELNSTRRLVRMLRPTRNALVVPPLRLRGGEA